MKESIYLEMPVVYSIMLEINNPVQNITHVYYFNIVNARFTSKLSIASENSCKKDLEMPDFDVRRAVHRDIFL